MKTAIIYHKADLDGIGSAAIALKHYPDAELYPADYGDEPYTGEEFLDKRVIIVDFCPSIIETRILKAASDVIWIDHHESAKKRHLDAWENDKIKGFRSTKHSAIMLTWMYFEHNATNKGDPENAPTAIQYIEDYDIWEFKYDNFTKAFGEYAPLVLISPEEPEWEKLLSTQSKDYINLVNVYIKNGNLLLKAKEKRIKSSFRGVKEITKWGHKVGMVNSNHDISNLGNYIAKNGYEIGMVWRIVEDKVKIGLRSVSPVTVNNICEQYKGGGHPFAGGFEMNIQEFYMEFLNDNN